MRGIDFCPGQRSLLRLVMPRRRKLIFLGQGSDPMRRAMLQCDIFGALLQEIPADFPALYDDWQVETQAGSSKSMNQVAGCVDDTGRIVQQDYPLPGTGVGENDRHGCDILPWPGGQYTRALFFAAK
ncbi:hypothetical protein P4S72_18740 [Vibrio sp. PP-XX7]